MRRIIPGASPNTAVAHLALYRKYRSQTFQDLVGQEHVVRTLQNAIRQGRVAHAYLLTGPRGTGKTSTARLLAKALNCETGPSPEPCNQCHACHSITEGSAMDVVELDAASESGVEQVRQAIVEAAEYKPASCRYRVFIIDEVHDLSAKAFDALLKTVEEPPSHVIFILATTEYQKVPPTIRSRCQRFEFHRGTVQNLTEVLAHVARSEGISCETSALSAIARVADGGYRDALTLLEQSMLTAEGEVTLAHVNSQLGLMDPASVDALLLAMSETDVTKVVVSLDETYRRGRDPRSVVESLLFRLADLTRVLYGVELGGESDAAVEAGLHATATQLGAERVLRFRSDLALVHRAIRDVSLPRVWLEAELIRIAMPRRAEPTREAQPATQKPKPVRAAAPRQVVVDPQEEAPEAVPEHPENAKWRMVVEALAAQSKIMGMKLPASRLVEANEDSVTIAFDRQFDIDWLEEQPKRIGAVQSHWSQVDPQQRKVKLVAAAKSAQPGQADTATVELPLTGERLVDASVEVFGERTIRPKRGT